MHRFVDFDLLRQFYASLKVKTVLESQGRHLNPTTFYLFKCALSIFYINGQIWVTFFCVPNHVSN